MSQRSGFGASRGGYSNGGRGSHQGGRGPGAGDGSGRGGGGYSSENNKLPPVWGRAEIEKLFGQGMLPPKPAQPNLGLVFDRYLKVWASDTSLIKEDRAGVLKRFTDEYQQLGESYTPLLKQSHARLAGVMNEGRGGSYTARAQARFVSGLGASHPLENGFTFDYHLGVPYIPGSAVKGLCRYFAELVIDEERLIELFGGDIEDESSPGDERFGVVGDMVFLPAYPLAWPRLEVDIVNNHLQAYYSQRAVALSELEKPSGKQAELGEEGGSQRQARGRDNKQHVGPLEIEDPVPVFFLSVAQGTEFVFRCFSRKQNPENLEQTLGFLKQGLAQLGIGAKTSLGYGIMESAG